MNLGYVYAPYVPIQILDQKERDMSDTTILKEKHPEIAEFVEAWRSKYERNFDLSDEVEKANFYEGMVEMAKHIATNADVVSLKSCISIDGVTMCSANAGTHTD